MKLPGTILSNKAIDNTKLRSHLNRLYTQKRAKDRSYKIYGHFTQPEADALIRELTKMGAIDARAVDGCYWDKDRISGVRFEY
jgi:hypothetical protein